jgi:ABC-type uncharacterized transport system auxiliary subunit
MKKLATILACLLLLAGCGSSDGIEKKNGQTVVKDKVVTIVIKDGKVTPQGKRVEVTVGQPVTLRVTADTDDEIHVHSEPEHEYEVAPGPAKDFTFVIDTPGQVAVELHHLEVTMVQLVVRP